MPPRIYINDKLCVYCHCSFNRRVSESRRLESPSEYRQRKFCSSRCYHLYNVGENHRNFKNGTKRRKDGYIRTSYDYYIHREIIETLISRRLKRWEVIHHKDNDPSNNSLENLELITHRQHAALHSKYRVRDNQGRFTSESISFRD